jgi:hypothetical protein
MSVETVIVDIRCRGRNRVEYIQTRIYGSPPTTIVKTRIYYQNNYIAPVTITIDDLEPPPTRTTNFNTIATVIAVPADIKREIKTSTTIQTNNVE